MPTEDLGDYDVDPVEGNPFGSMATSENDYDVAPVDHDPFADQPDEFRSLSPQPQPTPGIGSDARYPQAPPLGWNAPPLSSGDRDLLTKTVYGEARGEPVAGQEAIAHAILNRVRAGGYGQNIRDVVMEPAAGSDPRYGYHEFSPWNPVGKTGTPGIDTLQRDRPQDYARIGRLVDKVYSGTGGDPTYGATHYYGIMPRPPKWGPPLAALNREKIGNTTFVGRDVGPGRAPTAIASAYEAGGRVGYQDGGVTDLGEVDPDAGAPPPDDAPPPGPTYTAADVVAGRTPFGKQEASQYDDPTIGGQLGHAFEQGAGYLGADTQAQGRAGAVGQFIGSATGLDAPQAASDAVNYARQGDYASAASSGLGSIAGLSPYGAMFLGPTARAVDQEALAAAKAGWGTRDPGNIWRDLNWNRGADQGWRTEISDVGAGFTRWGRPGQSAPMSAVYEHPELYENYPELANMPVDFVHPDDMGGAAAFYHPGMKRIAIDTTLNDPQREGAMLHEIQHAVQHIEGFEGGTNPDDMMFGPGTPAQREMSEYFANTTAQQRKQIPRSQVTAYLQDRAYRANLGEVEARNTAYRAAMDAAQRRAQGPWATTDVPLARQWWKNPATGATEWGSGVRTPAGYQSGGGVEDDQGPGPGNVGPVKLDPAPAPAPTDQSLGQGEAASYGLVRGVPFGEDLGALVETGESYLPKWARAPGDAPVEQTGEAFSQRLAENRARISQHAKELEAAHPYTTFAAELVPGAVLPGAAETTAGRAAIGAGYGAAYGLGEGDTVEERLRNAAIGAPVGAAGSLALEGAGRVAGKVYSHYFPSRAGETITPAQESTYAQEAPGAAAREPPAGGGGEAGVQPPSGAPAPADPLSAESARAAAAAGSHAPLTGLPQKPLTIDGEPYIPGPLGKAKDAAAAYMRDAGLPYRPPTDYTPVNKGFATRVAGAYDAMVHDPNNPAVRASYEALARETMAQWQAVKQTGLNVEWIKPGMADPYAESPRLAAKDVRDNNHWWGFPTDLGYGSTGEDIGQAANPMLQQSGEVIDGMPARYNDLFRIVHDYFGHFKEGVGFRAEGEDNAFRNHAAMFSDDALPALASETRGQNSWVNFGPHGEANRTAKGADTVFADQKIGLMPPWTYSRPTGVSADRPEVPMPGAAPTPPALPPVAPEDQASVRMGHVPNIRKMSVADGTALARQDAHLVEAPEGYQGGHYLGSPTSVQSPEDLQALRKANQEYLRADPRGWDWYNRYRAFIHKMSGGDLNVGDWMSHSLASWSPNRPPSFEFGAATKETAGAMVGMPTRGGMEPQHQAFLNALAAGDPTLLAAGEKTGEYANKINPRRMFERPTATGVNDFRNARQWGFPFMRSQEADTLTSEQHRWLDYENAGLVDWANQNQIHGKTDWTGEQVQAAMWTRQKAIDLARDRNLVGRMRAANLAEVDRATKAGQAAPPILSQDQLENAAYHEAFEDANTTAADSFERHVAYAQREMQPGIPRHMPGAASAPQAEKEAYFDYPGAQWVNPATGREVVYGEARGPTGAGLYVAPSNRMQGFWMPPGATEPERNPGIAVPFIPGSMTGDPNMISHSGRALMEQGEGLAAFMSGQAVGGGQRFTPDVPISHSNAYGFDLPRALTEPEQRALQAVGAAHGFPHVVDTGKGVRFTDFDKAPPPQDRKTRQAFTEDLRHVMPQDASPATHGLMESVSVPTGFDPVQGTGEATRRLTKLLGRNWASWNLWNTHPGLRRVAQAFLDRDRAFAERWGEPAEDHRNALKIIADGPGWLDRLDQARRYGLPAATAAGVALVPSAGLPATLPQRPDDQAPAVRMRRQLRETAPSQSAAAH